MNRGGKRNSIERANKLLEERAINGPKIIKESDELNVGTPIVTLKGHVEGTIVGLKYIVKLVNGEVVELKQGDFYNNTKDDGLPF